MNIFYEKADEKVLKDCETFVQNNKNTKADYYVYRDALSNYVKLSQSLIDSQKEFDEAIKKETNKFIFLDDGPEKEFRTIQFTQANYSLVLDATAHQVLKELEQIEINNSTK